MPALQAGPGEGRPFCTQELRNARLRYGFDPLRHSARVTPADLRRLRREVRARAVPSRPVRMLQQVLYKAGALTGERALADGKLRARLGGNGAAPRLLVRVDELPHYRVLDDPESYGPEAFERFHAIMAGAGVPYLLAMLPRVSRAPLDPRGEARRELSEQEGSRMRALLREGVTAALHGRDHRTRFASPRRHSELCGLDRAATEALLEEGLAELARHGIEPEVFVAPFNRFDARQLAWLAQRFAVVCGGPESIGGLGFQRTPVWRGEAVYLPAYAPFYGSAAQLRETLPAAIERAGGVWLPLVLHWGWEADAGWRDLEALAELIAPHAVPWSELLEAVDESRTGAGGAG
ncbi:MAG TPA: DUF2334 domain-containing protein [Solirubrobacteraceae bacterium]|nr:DUF2334 domain-containing protein [Solirubrobacteraceae bacterium]